jgi:hypothetical protein
MESLLFPIHEKSWSILIPYLGLLPHEIFWWGCNIQYSSETAYVKTRFLMKVDSSTQSPHAHLSVAGRKSLENMSVCW